MKVEIPEEEQEVLRRWLIEDEPRMKQVVSVLEKAQPALARTGLAQAIVKEVGLDSNEADYLVRALMNLSATAWAFTEEDRTDAADAIFETLQPAGGDRASFDTKMATILGLRALEITGKVGSIAGDNPQSFCAARTLSEIRPVFSESGLEPQAAVIIHQLKIVYHDGPHSERKELFIAMDRGDLAALKGVLDRALSKHDKLASLVGKLELPLL